MSETTKLDAEQVARELKRAKQDRIDKCHWYEFDGKAVVIQLHEPWAGVTYPNDPVVQRGEAGEIKALVTVPILKGICHVKPDGNDVMFLLETSDPDPGKSAMVYIGIKRELVAYITYAERKLVSSV
jgi:hypothetical protein